MSSRSRRSRRAPRVWLMAAACAAAFVVWSCGSDDGTNPPDTNTTALAGVMTASDGSSGKLSLTADGVFAPGVAAPAATMSLSAAAPLAVLDLSGTAALADGSTVDLTGTWNTDTGALQMAGGGYTFTGTYANGRITGTWDGPSIDGVFSLLVASTSADIHVYCGTFTGREVEDMPSGGTGTAPDNGTWNMVVGTSTVDVFLVSDEGGIGGVSGTRSGSTVTLTVGGGSATGTLSGTNDAFVAGSYTIAGSGQGTFQGGESACGAVTETGTIASIVLNDPGIVSGAASERLGFDSTLVFATAKDAQGHYVAAPDLEWTITGKGRTNGEVTARGQKWFVADTLAGTATITVKSRNNPSVQAAAPVSIITF